jgi:hypothetical protein
MEFSEATPITASKLIADWFKQMHIKLVDADETREDQTRYSKPTPCEKTTADESNK